MQPHTITYPDLDSEQYYKARYHYLLQIIFGETVAIDYCKTIADFAPTEQARSFLLQQQTEEDTHLDLLTEYVGAHPRPQVLISPFLKRLDKVMLKAILEKDYVACVFIQNFIVEGLNVSLLRELEHHTDSVLSELSTKILRDEVRHMEFGVTEIKRILVEDPSKSLRRKLIRLQREVLFYSTCLAMTLARESKDIGIPMHEFSEKTVQAHFERITRAELTLPYVDRLIFNFVRVFLKIL